MGSHMSAGRRKSKEALERKRTGSGCAAEPEEVPGPSISPASPFTTFVRHYLCDYCNPVSVPVIFHGNSL